MRKHGREGEGSTLGKGKAAHHVGGGIAKAICGLEGAFHAGGAVKEWVVGGGGVVALVGVPWCDSTRVTNGAGSLVRTPHSNPHRAAQQ
jgi:hypothetical protein